MFSQTMDGLHAGMNEIVVNKSNKNAILPERAERICLEHLTLKESPRVRLKVTSAKMMAARSQCRREGACPGMGCVSADTADAATDGAAGAGTAGA